MKINFIGSPISGKTTLASQVFNKLKLLGINSEFITEQARMYISEIRYNSKNTGSLTLSDHDQLIIMTRQLKVEEVVGYSVSDGSHIICDSSPLNSLFYMSTGLRNSYEVKELVKRTLDSVDTVFYCEPVGTTFVQDPNRVHSSEEALKIDSQILDILKEEVPGLVPKIKTLKGNANDRASKVMNVLLGV